MMNNKCSYIFVELWEQYGIISIKSISEYTNCQYYTNCILVQAWELIYSSATGSGKP